MTPGSFFRARRVCLSHAVGFYHAAMVLLADAEVEVHPEPEAEGVEVGLAAFDGRGALALQEPDLPRINGFRVAEEIPSGLARALVGGVAEIRAGNHGEGFVREDV